MRISIKWVLTVGSLALLAALLIHAPPSRGQPGAPVRTYEPFVPTPEFAQADILVDQGKGAEAVALLQGVANANPGTTRGAVALLMIAGLYRDSGREFYPKALEVYRQVEAQYPRSGFEIGAKEDALVISIPFGQHDLWLKKADEIAQSYGGPALADVLRGDRTRLAERVRSLPLEYQQNGLDQLYLSMHDILAVQLHRWDDGIGMALFLRESFPSSALSDDITKALSNDLMEKKFGSRQSFEPVALINPTVLIDKPQQGQRKGPRPKIRVTITDGDFRQPQINMSQLKFTLDGQSLTPLMRVKSRINKGLKEGEVFERIKLVFRPSTPLAQGVHTVEVYAQVNGYSGNGPGVGRATLQFTVGKQNDDPDDEREDDDD